MKLIEQLRADRIAHFKKRNDSVLSKVAYSLLGVIIADSCKENKEPEDSKVLSIIKKGIDSAKECKAVTDHMSFEYHKADQEIDILQGYRPTQLSEQEIRDIATVRKDNGDNNLGAIMKFFKAHYEGQYDGALVSKIAKEIL